MRRERKFVDADFKVTDWEHLEPYFTQLQDWGDINSVTELEDWLRKDSELSFVVNEEQAWRFIRMTCNTEDESIRDHYYYFLREVLPKLSVTAHDIRKGLFANPFFAQLPADKYEVLIRSIQNRLDLFRESNVELNAEIRQVSQQYDGSVGKMYVEENGEKLTLQQAAALLESPDRDFREQVWRKIAGAWKEKRNDFNQLFSELTLKRDQVAANADEASYSAYKFRELERFDYTRSDCEQFHQSIEQVITPILIQLNERRRQNLGVDKLQPWDLTVDEFGEERLRPFNNADELIEKVVDLFGQIDPQLGQQINTMRETGYLDLSSRLGKAPGGYNYSLPESGIPFIFMNAVGTHTDLTTMLHEGGHAIHSFATNHLNYSFYTKLPSEVAELASMSMELIGLDFLGNIYPEPRKRMRAKRDQILRIFTILPWIATIDAFQFWVYDHPSATDDERGDAWLEIFRRFHGDSINWKDHREAYRFLWHKQGHIFDVPFYYIEYGFAQLGAIAVWQNFKADPEKGMADYRAALAMGYTRPIPEIYARAGVRFDFSESYIRELAVFLQAELQGIETELM